MRKSLILVFILIISFSSISQTLTFNTADSSPYSTNDNKGFYDVLLAEVLSRLSIDLKINHYPSERSISRVNNGYDDGEYARISGMDDMYSDLIMVNESLVSFDFVAIKKINSNISPKNWGDLKQMSVGYLRGWKIYENNIGEGLNIRVLNNVDSMFNMLEADRVDIILYSRLRAIKYIKEKSLKDLEVITPPLSERPMYLYLHKKHTKIVPQIEQELKSIKDDGIYNNFYNKYLIDK